MEIKLNVQVLNLKEIEIPFENYDKDLLLKEYFNKQNYNLIDISNPLKFRKCIEFIKILNNKLFDYMSNMIFFGSPDYLAIDIDCKKPFFIELKYSHDTIPLHQLLWAKKYNKYPVIYFFIKKHNELERYKHECEFEF
jgi:hypothetical protein